MKKPAQNNKKYPMVAKRALVAGKQRVPLPVDVHRRVKALAAARGETLENYVARSLRELADAEEAHGPVPY